MGYSNPPFGMPDTWKLWITWNEARSGELETNQFKIRCVSFVWPEVFFSKSWLPHFSMTRRYFLCSETWPWKKSPYFYWTILGI